MLHAMEVLLVVLFFKSMLLGVLNANNHEGEVCCYDRQFLQLQLQYNESTFRNSEFFKKAFWPDGIFWFDIDPHMDPVITTFVVRGIDYFNDYLFESCIKWEQRLPDGTHDHINHWTTFVQTRDDADFLHANLGYAFDEVNNTHVYISYHYVLKNRKLSDEWFLSQLLHEMMHIMGFNHEFDRRDRDCCILVSDYFVHEDPGTFEVHTEDYFYSTGFPYDYDSIMHYHIVPTDFYPHDKSIKTLGREDGKISELDWDKIKSIYCYDDYYLYCTDFEIECVEKYKSYLTNPNCFREGANYGDTPLTCEWKPEANCDLKFTFT